MKTLNNFFEKAHLFKVWLVIYPILIIFISSLFYGLEYLSGERIITDSLIYLKFGAFVRIEDKKEKRLFLIQDYFKKWKQI